MKYLDTLEGILIDSGGQYLYGTTGVTRTWHLGVATDEFKETYTFVLKGNIGVIAWFSLEIPLGLLWI
jgi:Xaa-Pro aminopeptidase